MRILLIETNPVAAREIELLLCSNGFAVSLASTGRQGINLARAQEYSLILLNLSLSGENGHVVLRALRAKTIRTPILMVSNDHRPRTAVKALDVGADDYLTTPFHPNELLARIHSLVRRSRGHANPILIHGPLLIDLVDKTVTINGHRILLRGREYQVLELLAHRAGSVVEQETIFEYLKNESGEITNPGFVKVLVHRIRSKLLKSGPSMCIATVDGRGYTLDADKALQEQWGPRYKHGPPMTQAA